MSIHAKAEFYAAIEAINSAKLPSIHHVDDLPDELYDALNNNCVEHGLDVDEHRWYEISTSVYDVNGMYLGLRGLSKLYSESSSWGDIGVNVEAFEMIPVSVVSYVRKSDEE